MIKQSNKVSSKRLTLKDNNSSINSSDEENEVESEYCLEDLLDEEEDLMN